MQFPSLTLASIDPSGAVADPLPLTDICRDLCRITSDWYARSGYLPPWICYLVRLEDRWVGTCGFKGAPDHTRVEIAYHTFPECEGQGFGTAIAAQLVDLARSASPSVRVCAQTLPVESASTSILRKNGFVLQRLVEHPEDGTVWEWEQVQR